MHVDAAVVARLEVRYGVPREGRFEFAFADPEWRLLRASQRGWRTHDVTLFIRKGDRWVGIRKPSYPPGLFRAPSGGVEPGESFEAGAAREALEETGLEIRLERYVFRALARFTHAPDAPVEWSSHVFAAEWVSGDLEPRDADEIAEAAWLTREEIAASVPLLRAAPSGGLRYRAALTDAVLALIP